MSELASIERLEELEAGRILGDLSNEEWREWETLSEDHSDALDGSLEWAAAQLEAGFSDAERAPMPETLSSKIKAGTAEFVKPVDDSKIVRGPWWNSAPIAWSAAAAVAFMLIVSLATRPDSGDVIVDIVAEVDGAGDRIESPFEGLGDYEGMSGKAVWSDKLQEGYMTFENMPVNDPAMNQYQLWIVDPERDEAPVDGGVFDISQDGSVRVLIDSKLRVDDPTTFVITLEQPGGVVKSKQEVVVALASVGGATT
ncbi:MAG: anti-sigma factor [Verrucomicrobiota bacterium]